MNRGEVKKVLQCPSWDLLELALHLVNLKDKEYQAIFLCDIKGFTEEETSNKLLCSKKSIQNWRKSAYKKLEKVWKNNKLIETILDL